MNMRRALTTGFAGVLFTTVAITMSASPAVADMRNLANPATPSREMAAAPSTSFIALGDSYSSGEGVPPFETGTDTHYDTCHRSQNAWPYLLS